MDKIEIGVWAVWHQYSKTFGYALSESDMSDHGWIKIKDAAVEFDPLRHQDIVKLATQCLRKEKQKILADAQVKANAIQGQIDEMLALDHKMEQQQ